MRSFFVDPPDVRFCFERLFPPLSERPRAVTMSIWGRAAMATRMPSMTELSAYALEPIREGADFTRYRGRQHGRPPRVLAVALAAEHPSPQGLRALIRHEGRAILILMDPGGEPLDLVLQQGQLLDLTSDLRIAIGLATARPGTAAWPHGCRCSGSPAPGGLHGSSSLEENFTKRIDLLANFLAAVTLSTAMNHLKVEKNHRGALRIPARTPPKG
jgi:hypothetical protein